MELTIIMPVYNGSQFIKKALSSIPVRDDIHVIAVDDASTDNTRDVVCDFMQKSHLHITLTGNTERGRACTCINKALDMIDSGYVMQLDCDDWLHTDNFNDLLDMRLTHDLIFFPNKLNSGEIWDPKTHKSMCDHSCLYKREVIGDKRHEFGKTGTGAKFHFSVATDRCSRYYHDKVIYYYNHPREGSNLDLAKKGLL